MENETYMEKLYQLAMGKKSPSEVFVSQLVEQVTPQLRPKMPPVGYPSPLKYPPDSETADIAITTQNSPTSVNDRPTVKSTPSSTVQDLSDKFPFLRRIVPSNIVRDALAANAVKSEVKDLSDEFPFLRPLLPSNILRNAEAVKSDSQSTLRAKPVGKVDKKKSDESEDDSKSANQSVEVKKESKATPSLIEATIETARKLRGTGEGLPIPTEKRATALPYGPAEDIKEATDEATESMKPGIADSEKDKSLEKAQKDQSRDIVQRMALTKTWPDKRPTSRAGEILQELLFETQERMKDLDPDSVERRQLDRLTEAILAFGGPLLGSLTGGTAGELAGAAAGQAGLQTLAQERKNLEDEYQTKLKGRTSNINERIRAMNRDQLERLKTLMDLEKLDADEFRTRLQYETEILRTQMELAKATLGIDSREYIEASKLYNSFVKAFSELLVKGATAAGTVATKADQAEKDRQSKETIAREKNAIDLEIAKLRERYRRLYGDKTSTDAERRAAGFYTTAQNAAETIKSLVGKYYDEYPALSSLYRTIAHYVRAQNKLVSVSDIINMAFVKASEVANSKEEAQRMMKAISAEVAILEAIGRVRSGAVIRPDEYLSIREEIFPTYGNSPEVVRQKMGQLNAALAGLRIAAGRALSQVPDPSTLMPPPPPTRRSEEDSEKAKRLREIQERIKKIREKKK